MITLESIFIADHICLSCITLDFSHTHKKEWTNCICEYVLQQQSARFYLKHLNLSKV